MRHYESWGRFIHSKPARLVELRSRESLPALRELEAPCLVYGAGRSYGDSCLNDGGTLLDARPMSRLISFDRQNGIAQVEAGLTLAELLRVIVPAGWFVPVTPGTKFVTIGGCIANDVHGKNHHRAGTFGRHVRWLELARSDGSRLRCSASENGEMFAATVGGLGLTGIISCAEIALRRIESAEIERDNLSFASLEEWDELSRESDRTHEYTVAWFDVMRSPVRGVLFRGNHAVGEMASTRSERKPLRLPLRPLSALLGPRSMSWFNELYYRLNARPRASRRIGFEPFFFPLDAVSSWNEIYGRGGLVQYQLVIPADAGLKPVAELLQCVRAAGLASFLTVLKRFGPLGSPGLMSFPREGITVALDFPARNPQLLRALDGFDQLVAETGGAVYPAKDARMSRQSFERFFPQWRVFAGFVDPRFSSSFWRRVTYSAR